MNEKERIRKKILLRLETLDPKEKRRRSRLIRNKVFSTQEYKDARMVFTYVSNETEVDTLEIIQETLEKGKRVSIPSITNYKRREMIASEIYRTSDWKKNKWGIYQPSRTNLLPVDEEDIDIMLIPGIAFDYEGNRLGRGKGFFDKFLKTIKTIPSFGLAFTFQLFDSIPCSRNDISVTRVIYA